MSSGLRDGGYWSTAKRLQAVALELGMPVEVRESRGSLENLGRLEDRDNPVGLALTQTDALQYYLNEHPDLAPELEILEQIGQECVYLIAGRGAVDSLKDINDAGDYRVGIVSRDSGVAVTFNYMQQLLPELADSQPVYVNTATAMKGLNSANSEVDAVLAVHRPKEMSPELRQALESPGKYQLIPIPGRSFKQKLPDGQPVYTSLNLKLPPLNGNDSGAVQTICLKGLLLAHKAKLSSAQRDVIGEIIYFNWMKVYVPGRPPKP